MATFFFLYSNKTINQLGIHFVLEITSIPSRTFFLRKEDKKRVQFRLFVKARTVLSFLFDLQPSSHFFLKLKGLLSEAEDVS